MVIAIPYAGGQTPSKPNWLLIGQEPVAVAGRTIAQCLEEMYQQGWHLTQSRAAADHYGIICEYDFAREPANAAPNTPSPQPLDEQEQTG